MKFKDIEVGGVYVVTHHGGLFLSKIDYHFFPWEDYEENEYIVPSGDIITIVDKMFALPPTFVKEAFQIKIFHKNATGFSIFCASDSYQDIFKKLS